MERARTKRHLKEAIRMVQWLMETAETKEEYNKAKKKYFDLVKIWKM